MGRTATAILVVAVIVLLGAILSHNPQVARFAAKQAASAKAGSDAPSGKITVKEWDVPTPNSHPHDPAVAPDGALWYTGQMSNTLGRLDPVTGQIQEYRLKTPNSGPHGLVADREGNIWFTAIQRVYRQARSANKRGTRIPFAGQERGRPAYSCFRSKTILLDLAGYGIEAT